MTIQHIPVSQLRIHPKNIRLYYPPADVAEMAASIAAVGGVIESLLIVPTGQREPATGEESLPTYYVVDGNMRLTAARTIPNCPPLKCEQLSSNQAEQLLVMAATSHFHYPKDAISKARHYRRLIEDEGLTPTQIAELTGLSSSSIYNAINLLELTTERAQTLIGEGKLAGDIALHRLIARIPDAAKRAELIERFAARGMSANSAIKSTRFIIKQYERLSKLAAEPAAPAESQQPEAVAHLNGGSATTNGKTTAPRLPVVAAPLPPKNAPRNNGNANAKPGAINAEKVGELARLHLCSGCQLNNLGDRCYTCPGPYEFISHLVDLLPAETLGQAVGEAPVITALFTNEAANG